MRSQEKGKSEEAKRLRLRFRLSMKCFGGSDSGSDSEKKVRAPVAPSLAPAIFSGSFKIHFYGMYFKSIYDNEEMIS